MDASVASSLASGGGSVAATVAGGIIGAFQARKQRKWAAEQNQLNRDFAASEAQKQREWEREQYNLEFSNSSDFQREILANEQNFSREQLQSEQDYAWKQLMEQENYNSASAQRSRLEAAGLNPYLMMSGGNAGSVSGGSSPSGASPTVGAGSPSAGSAAAAAAPGSLGYTPYFPDFSGLGSAFSAGVDAYVKAKQAKDLVSQPGLANKETGARINVLGAQSENLAEDTALKQANRIYVYLKAEGQQILNRFATARQQAELSEITSSILLRVKLGQLTEEQAKSEIVSREKMYAETNNIKIKNNLLSELANDIVDAYKAKFAYDAEFSRSEMPFLNQNAFNRAEQLSANLKYLDEQIHYLQSQKDLTDMQRKDLERLYKIRASVEARSWLRDIGYTASMFMPSNMFQPKMAPIGFGR